MDEEKITEENKDSIIEKITLLARKKDVRGILKFVKQHALEFKQENVRSEFCFEDIDSYMKCKYRPPPYFIKQEIEHFPNTLWFCLRPIGSPCEKFKDVKLPETKDKK